ncbi:uncharacterized protein BDCG_17604 [Blastomyces dermatitidis ER-3]|uniref:Uncharacterized protein n=1 Tax=Ajellomyces dermatitidis (strain ER-3 / ATCC MYA-2586) TaxID=559297 RepID=A0ABX2VZE4_AJEDR|nr:uncharacterized protein BDCG_17604 [Blastomyces dermatitidis ER-3]OAT02509.1 hypothetical protein BDCG_17604 [Blastomyces dermatitidis ER-3]
MKMMSFKKKLTAAKMGAVSMMKKALILEKLFQSLSQEECDALLHMSDREEKTGEETSEEKIDENEMKENDEDEELEFQTDELLILLTYLFTYKVIKGQDKEKTVTSYHHLTRLHDAITEESTDESHDRSLKREDIKMNERRESQKTATEAADDEELMSEFEKTAAEKMNVDDIIKISDMRKKDDSTIVSMKRMSMSFKHKALSLIALKLSKCV